MENLWSLFVSFLKVGSFSFGGVYTLIPLIEREVVTNHGWLTPQEFLKVLGMVQVFPGAISIKFATFTGYKVAGIPGALVANLGNMTVPVAAISIGAYFYSVYENNEYVKKAFTGIKFAVIGMIAVIMFRYATINGISYKEFGFILLGAALIFFFKLDPVFVILIAALFGIFIL
jgi:chromate transporter